MSDSPDRLQMPAARDFGWQLKPTESSHFAIHERDNGQFCVVLNHALIRGVRSEMLHWWFLHFPKLRVRLFDVPGYDNTQVPAYLLWHPIDHYAAQLSGRLGPGETSRAGAKITIREAMQYDKHAWKYPVDATLKIFYVGEDGWAMGRSLPVLGPVMMLRIHFKDVVEGGAHVGVHYHYEVVIGLSGENPLARQVNKKVSAKFGPEFFAAWHRHNVIEVGVFENFLPPLYAQRETRDSLEYRPDMNPMVDQPTPQEGYDKGLFETRFSGFQQAEKPLDFQRYQGPSFL